MRRKNETSIPSDTSKGAMTSGSEVNEVMNEVVNEVQNAEQLLRGRHSGLLFADIQQSLKVRWCYVAVHCNKQPGLTR